MLMIRSASDDAKRDATAYPLVAGVRRSGDRSAPNRRWRR